MRADCLPFANVSVRVNGKDLIEYQTEGASDDDPMVATTYIEAVEGAIFDVCVNLEPGFAYAKNHLSNEMSLDGAWVAGKITALSPLWRTTIMDGVTELTAEGTATFRCFKFAAHQTSTSQLRDCLKRDTSKLTMSTADAKPGSFSQRDKLSSLGEIKVQLLRCRRTRTSYNPVKNDFKGVIKDGIPEKALKGRAVSCHAE